MSDQATYLFNLAALLGLAGLSFGLSYLQLGAWEVPVALGIAAVKAVLVLLFFMHLARHGMGSVLALLAAVGFIGLLVALVAADPATRMVPLLSPPR